MCWNLRGYGRSGVVKASEAMGVQELLRGQGLWTFRMCWSVRGYGHSGVVKASEVMGVRDVLKPQRIWAFRSVGVPDTTADKDILEPERPRTYYHTGTSYSVNSKLFWPWLCYILTPTFTRINFPIIMCLKADHLSAMDNVEHANIVMSRKIFFTIIQLKVWDWNVSRSRM
jgi:hypothetical protein